MIAARRAWLAVLVGVGATLLAGCGAKKGFNVNGAQVKGTVVMNGAPLKFAENETVTITFVAVEAKTPDGKAIATGSEVKKPDGAFEIKGPSGGGIPAGKYKVVLASEVYGGDGTNKYEQAFSLAYTSLVADVPAGDAATFEIDLGKKTVTKK